jgi:cellulose synthase/poly-beta-1,6-N-acetylglucosamine synthase-like glycosyltransferase
MTTLAWFLFAIPLVLGIYAYIGYPALLWLIARIRSRPATVATPGDWPMVSIVLPAYNEEAQIRGAIEALLAQDYPADRRQILVLSDASTDATDQIVSEYFDRGVELLRMPVRGGKTAAENASCALLRGEIVVNTDSSIRLLPGTVKAMVKAMVDPTVGVASGRDVSVSATTAAANATEAGYVNYEMAIRDLETRVGGIVGASGSGYAIRTKLHLHPIRDDLSRDFSAALTARIYGYSAVSVNEALCVVPRTSSLRHEYKRKVRTISRGMATLWYNKQLLSLTKHGVFAWKLLSHKICRWLLPVSAVPGMAGLVMLARDHAWAAVLLAGAALLGVLALIGRLWPEGRPMPRPISVAAFGLSANLAVINAWWRVGRGPHDHIWEPTRRTASPAPQA